MSARGSTSSERGSNSNTPSTTMDAILWKWAESELGGGFTVEAIDTSKVKVKQEGMYYEGTHDWFTQESLDHELSNNDLDKSIKWVFETNIKCSSEATWTVSSTLNSNILPKCNITLDFPSSDVPLNVFMESNGNNNEQEKHVKVTREYPIKELHNLDPFTTVQACVQLRRCVLHDVTFHVNISYTGTIIIRGHKKRKFGTKAEVKADVAAALKEIPGFRTVEGLSQEPKCLYTLEGTCTGHAVVSCLPHFSQIQTLV